MRSLIGYSKWPLLVLTLLVCSCSATWHLNQAVKKDPSILSGKKQVWDTTYVTKERIAHDTIWTNKDTTIVHDSVVIKYQVLSNGKSTITATCPPEKIKIQKEFVTQYVTAPKKGIPVALMVWVAILFLALSILKVIYSSCK